MVKKPQYGCKQSVGFDGPAFTKYLSKKMLDTLVFKQNSMALMQIESFHMVIYISLYIFIKEVFVLHIKFNYALNTGRLDLKNVV